MTRYCDAHIHLSHSKEPLFEPDEQYFCVTSCHSKEEFESLGRYGEAVFQSSSPSGVSPFANAHCQQAGNFGATYPTAKDQLIDGTPRQNHRFYRDSLKTCLASFVPSGRSLPTAKDQLIDGTPRQNHRFCQDSLKTCLASFAPSGRSLPYAFATYGIHPQSPLLKNKSLIEEELSYMENLIIDKKIIAIGECGFDFFTPEFRSTAAEQETVFNEQLFLAQKYNLPLVLHLRKSIEKIFTYSRQLKKIPAVVFHSFPGTFREAQSLTNHGINAFFSFGKPILNGKKASIDCVQNLPLQNLLFETDAPYQTLKGETETSPTDIKKVYRKACELRKINLEELSETVFKNFQIAFENSVILF